MAYTLFDRDGNEINLHDLQDKGFWYDRGVRKEEVFVDKYGDRLNLDINPKKQTNKAALDLINTQNNREGDLKTQNTPFFTAEKNYNINPQYAVTFNNNDKERYEKKYEDIDIYFAIDWQAVRIEFPNDSFDPIEVNPMEGIWRIRFLDLCKMVEKNYLHEYKQRKNDNRGNAKSSYVLDLNDNSFTRLI